ncbi:hypothetical protein ACA910_004890 [Epithemia clementina (nom. ined.)]
MRPNRSVVDFESEEALRKALMAVQVPDDDISEQKEGEYADEAKVDASDAGDAPASMGTENLDWVLPSFDSETTEVQSMKEELHRLRVLRSYLILDAEREEAFERITRLGARYFHAPICLISLVDLGRQWFMSNRGLGVVRETPRKHAFCAHAILNKHNILIVPDATKDFRFKANPLVTGPPDIRFYAGAPLISPEGYKLGTFCIIDDKPRPAGLSQDDQASLRDFADMAVKEMVERRANLKRHQSPAQLIAYTAHDLMTPLTGVQLSLSLLKGDEEVKDRLGGHQHELLSTASNCSDLMIRICQTAIDTLRDESTAAVLPETFHTTKTSAPVTKFADLIRNLLMIMEPIPKTVPLIVTLDSDVPPAVVSDDLKIFRSALNLITNGVERTSRGLVHLRIFVKADESSKLLFECTDTGREVHVDDYQCLFRPSRTADGDFKLGLSSVATMINVLDGEYGFRPSDGFEEDKSVGLIRQNSVFWFSVPLYTPENFGVNPDDELPVSVMRKITSNTSIHTDTALKHPIITVLPKSSSGNLSMGSACPDATFWQATSSKPLLNVDASFALQSQFGGRISSANSVSSAGHRRIPVVVGDQSQADAMNNSCFRDIFQPVTTDAKLPAVPFSVSVASLSNEPNPQMPIQTGQVQRKRRSLIIEDSLVVRKSLARALEKLGMVVTQAVDGLEGLKCMKSQIFDFVLCDFLMPVMDGLDCVQQYRDWEKQHRPDVCQFIVGISAHGGANDGNRGIKAGMNDFKPKPVSIKVLTEIQKANEVADLSKKLDELEVAHGGPMSAASSACSLGAPTEHARKSASSLQSAIGFTYGHTFSTQSSKRSPACLSAQQNFIFDTDLKRQKIDQGFVLSGDQGCPVCLFATGAASQQPSEALRELERQGWKVMVVHDGQDTLRHLKMRNWNAVLIDDNLPLSGGAQCANEFRIWEQHNRVNRQRNVYMVCKVPVPSVFDRRSVVQAPTGFDGVLGTPVEWKQLNHLIGMKKDRSLDIIVGAQL